MKILFKIKSFVAENWMILLGMAIALCDFLYLLSKK